MEPEVMTAKEVAKVLHLSPSQVYRMARDGELKVLELHGIRFSKAEIMAKVRSGKLDYDPENERLKRIIAEQKKRIETLEGLLVGGANYLLSGVQKEVLNK